MSELKGFQWVSIQHGGSLVWEGLKVDRGGRDLLLGSVEAMGEVSTGGKIQSHDAIVRGDETRVGGEVSRGARVRLERKDVS